MKSWDMLTPPDTSDPDDSGDIPPIDRKGGLTPDPIDPRDGSPDDPKSGPLADLVGSGADSSPGSSKIGASEPSARIGWGSLPEMDPKESSFWKNIREALEDPKTYLDIVAEKVRHNARFLSRLLLPVVTEIRVRVFSLFFWAFGGALKFGLLVFEVLREAFEVLKEYSWDKETHGRISRIIQSLGVRTLGIIGGILGGTFGEFLCGGLFAFFGIPAIPLVVIGAGILLGATGSWCGTALGAFIYHLSLAIGAVHYHRTAGVSPSSDFSTKAPRGCLRSKPYKRRFWGSSSKPRHSADDLPPPWSKPDGSEDVDSPPSPEEGGKTLIPRIPLIPVVGGLGIGGVSLDAPTHNESLHPLCDGEETAQLEKTKQSVLQSSDGKGDWSLL